MENEIIPLTLQHVSVKLLTTFTIPMTNERTEKTPGNLS